MDAGTLYRWYRPCSMGVPQENILIDTLGGHNVLLVDTEDMRCSIHSDFNVLGMNIPQRRYGTCALQGRGISNHKGLNSLKLLNQAVLGLSIQGGHTRPCTTRWP